MLLSFFYHHKTFPFYNISGSGVLTHAGDYPDKSELAKAVKEILKCLSSRAVKPSALRRTLRMLELERVHALLSHQCLTSIAEREPNVSMSAILVVC